MPLEQPTPLTDNLYKLLPANATKLERDLLKLVPYDSVLQVIASQIGAVGDTVFPDDWKVWVLQELGLLPLLEAIGDIDLVLENSKYIVEHHGTVAAVVRVCNMLGYPNAAVWEHEWPTTQFGEFQVYLGKLIASQASLEALENAVKAVKPTRSRIRRFYSFEEHDVRRLMLNRLKTHQNCVLNRQILGHFSGFPSVHNPYLWVSSVQEDVKEINISINGSGFNVYNFDYTDTGSVSGFITDSGGEPITDGDGDAIEYTSYVFPE
ncbi:MAG: phage tail protein [Chitinophagaceae bacterium]